MHGCASRRPRAARDVLEVLIEAQVLVEDRRVGMYEVRAAPSTSRGLPQISIVPWDASMRPRRSPAVWSSPRHLNHKRDQLTGQDLQVEPRERNQMS